MAWDNNYRRLEEGETILETDEVMIDKPFGWKAGTCVGKKAPNPNFTAHRTYRRIKNDD